MFNKFVLLIVAAVTLAACNTATGVAKDVWGGTKYVGSKLTEGNQEGRAE